MVTVDGTALSQERIDTARDKVLRMQKKSMKNSDFYSPLWGSDCSVILTGLKVLEEKLKEESAVKDTTDCF